MEHFKAPEGWVYLHKTKKIIGEIIIPTPDYPYKPEDFDLITEEEAAKIIEKWRLEYGTFK